MYVVIKLVRRTVIKYVCMPIAFRCAYGHNKDMHNNKRLQHANQKKGERYGFIRTVYNSVKKRGDNVQIGSASVEDFTLDMREGFAFTAQEQEQWDQYCFDVKYDKSARRKVMQSLRLQLQSLVPRRLSVISSTAVR